MACKTAVVCTDIGAVKDFAVDGETALLVKPGDIESMAKDVIELLGNPYMRYRLSEKGYKKSQQFRWENTAERFVELVNQRL
jgi:glycosyltransferase involved in cell wall biosynthesis